MLSNIGAPDRVIRILIGAAALAFTVTDPGTAWGYVGLIPLFTGTVGWCPLYSVFHVSTCPRPAR